MFPDTHTARAYAASKLNKMHIPPDVKLHKDWSCFSSSGVVYLLAGQVYRSALVFFAFAK